MKWHGKPLARLKHPAIRTASGWTYTARVRDLYAAKWWGCPSPGFFDRLPHSEKLDIVAMYEFDWKQGAINAHEAEVKAKAKAKRHRKIRRGR